MQLRLLYSYLFCALSVLACSQNAEQDFAKINANLLNAANISIETEYRTYVNHTTQTPYEILKGLMKQKGFKIYQSNSTVQAIMNDKISLQIDTSDRTIVLGSPVNIEEHKKQAFNMDLKKTLSKCKTVTYKDVSKTVGAYSLIYKDNVTTEFGRMDFYFNKQTYLPTKMVMYYDEEMILDEENGSKKEKPRMEILFTKIDTRPSIRDDIFDEKRFIKLSGSKYLPAQAYKGYKIIDTRFTTKK